MSERLVITEPPRIGGIGDPASGRSILDRRQAEFERKDDGYGCRECSFWFHESLYPIYAGQIYVNHELHHYYALETDIQKILRGRKDLIKGENK